MRNSAIWIDFDDREIKKLREQLNEAKRGMQEAIRTTGNQVKRIIKDDVDKHYIGGKNWIGSAVESPQMKQPLQCIIPLKGTRGVIGQQFPTGGGAFNTSPYGAYGFTGHGQKMTYGRLRNKKGAKITAKILRGKTSTLPSVLPNQGGNPPFLNRGTVYTRRTNDRMPIVRVVGLSVPQMVVNRAKADITKDIISELEKNVELELQKRLK